MSGYHELDIGPIELDNWKEKGYPPIKIDVREEVAVITSDEAKRLTPAAMTRAAVIVTHGTSDRKLTRVNTISPCTPGNTPTHPKDNTAILSRSQI